LSADPKPFGLQPGCAVKVLVDSAANWPWRVKAGEEVFLMQDRHTPFQDQLKHHGLKPGDLIELGVNVVDEKPVYRARLVSRNRPEPGSTEEAHELFDATVRHYKRCFYSARSFLAEAGEDAGQEVVLQIAGELFRARHGIDLRLLSADPQDLPF